MHRQSTQAPAWAATERGVPVECVACLDPNTEGATTGKLDLQFNARNVSILRPGRAQAAPYVHCATHAACSHARTEPLEIAVTVLQGRCLSSVLLL